MKRVVRVLSAGLFSTALAFGTVGGRAFADEEPAHAPAHGDQGPAVVQGHEGHEAPGATAGHGTEHGEHATAGEHGGGEHELKPVNWTDVSNKKQPPYIAMLVNFALLLFLYYRFGKKPVAEALEKRREGVAKQIEEASRIKKEAEERAKKYQSQLDRLDAEAEQTKAAIRTSGEADRERVLREAQEKAARMERDAATLLEAEQKAAKRALYEEAVEGAVVRAEELLRSKLTQADHERLAEDFLTQLAGRQSGGARGSTGGAQAAAPMDKRGEP